MRANVDEAQATVCNDRVVHREVAVGGTDVLKDDAREALRLGARVLRAQNAHLLVRQLSGRAKLLSGEAARDARHDVVRRERARAVRVVYPGEVQGMIEGVREREDRDHGAQSILRQRGVSTYA